MFSTLLQRTSFFRSFVLIFPLLFLLNTSMSFGQEAQAIGRVLSTTGTVTASNEAGDARGLQRGSEIFAGDTITTGPNSFASLRMVDSAQIAFKENTIFAFQTYNTDGPGGAPDNALMNMVQGGFRTISGSIGDDAGDNYEVSTQFASIGIRGTTHEGVIDAGRLLTGVYDGGTTISNAQGSLDTGEDANFNYSQTFPGQAPQGLLQQPAQLGQININQGAGNDGDDDDDANDGNDTDNDDGDGGLADADDEEPATRPLGNQQNNNNDDPDQRFGLAGNTDPDNDQDPSNDIGRTDTQINPALSVRGSDDFQSTGTGTVGNPDPAPPSDPGFAQPSAAFLALAANSGFNTDFSLSELAGTTGRVNQVLAFSGLADTGGIAATAVGDNGPTTPITALNMSFDLNFSASLGQVSNGHLEILLGNAAIPITYNIYFDGTIASSVANFIIASNSNRIQGNTTTQINLSTSFLDGILVDDGSAQALFTEFFFEDTQGLGVEGETLVGFATPVLSPADRTSVAQRVGFVLSRSAAPGAIFPGNVTELAPGAEVILAGSDPEAPFAVSLEPPYVFRGTGSFIQFTDGTITNEGENPYDFEIGVWNTGRLYEDYADNTDFTDILQPLVVVSVDPASLTSLTGSRTYMTNYDRILGSSSAGSITNFFTAFDVDFTTALVTNGSMEFCLGGGEFCSNQNSQHWSFDYSGSVIDGYVVAQPVNNTGYINHQLASIFGQIEGVFTGDNGEAFVGGFNLFYDADLDIYRNQVASAQLAIPDTTVDGVFLIEEETRFSAAEADEALDYDGFLVQERLARILLGYTRPTTDNPILFVDQRSRPRLVLADDGEAITISNRNQNLVDMVSDAFDVNWERWEGELIAYDNNLDASSILINGAVAEAPTDPVSFFSTFKTSDMTDITGHYNHVLGFIGEDGDGNPISTLSMSFDINFSASINNIENGELSLQTSYFEEWKVFFEGSLNRNIVEFDLLAENPNNLGEMSGIYCDGLCSSLDIADSNMQGAIVDDDAGNTALLSSFYFREDISDYIIEASDNPIDEMYRSRVSGLALVAREDPRFEVIRENEIRDTKQPYLASLGFFMPLDPDSSSIDFITAVRGPLPWVADDFFAEIDPEKPLYPVGFGKIFTGGLDPYNEVLAETESEFPGLFDVYGFSWGLWQEPEVSTDGPRLYSSASSPESFELLGGAGHFWGVVNEPVISSYAGSATYSHFLNDEGYVLFASGDGWYSASGIEVYDFDFAFDVDFQNGLVTDGFLNFLVEDSGDEGIWKTSFSGLVRDGYFVASAIDLNIYDNEGALVSDNTQAALQGVFGGNEDSASMYPAFFGGFNLASQDLDQAITGAVLAEVNPQHTAAQLNALYETYNDDALNYAILNVPYPSGEGIYYPDDGPEFFDDESAIGFQGEMYGIASDELNADNFDVFFHGYDSDGDIYDYECDCYLDFTYFTSVDFEQSISEHAGFTHLGDDNFKLTEEEFDLDMGYWSGPEANFEVGFFKEFYDYEYCNDYNCVEGFDLEQSSFDSPAFWLNYTPLSIGSYQGRFSTVLDSFGEFRLTDSGNNSIRVPVDTLTVDLMIDFSYGDYISGMISAVSAEHADLNGPLSWTSYIDGDIYSPFNGDPSPTLFDIDPLDGTLMYSADTDILFDFTGTDDLPILLGSYQSRQFLSEGGQVDVAGIFATQSRVGVVVESSQFMGETFVPGSVSFGLASRPMEDGESSSIISPRIGLNFDQNGGQDIDSLDLLPVHDLVVTGTSAVDEDFYYNDYGDPVATNIGYYSGVADWGYWDSANMSIIHNQLNSLISSGDELFWASIQPASLATLEGTWSYYGYDAIGIGNLTGGGDGTISDFAMNFTVDFDNGDISNGNFSATLNETDTWAMTFQGDVNGIFAEMHSFNGSFNGRPILGEMEAVFTGAGSELYQTGAMTGFSLYNDLGDHIDGLGFLHGGD